MQRRSITITDTPFPKVRDLAYEDRWRRANRVNSTEPEPASEILGMDLEQFLLSRKVNELEQELWHARRSNVTDFVALIGKIQELSQRLFPGPVTMDYASDPEDPTNEYIVFDVVAQGEFADYKERIFQWHDEIERLYPNVLSEFRLIVHPMP